MSEASRATDDAVTDLSLRVASHALWFAVAAGRGEYDKKSLVKILERARVVLAGMPPDKVSNGATSETTRRHLALIAIDGWFGNARLQAHLSRPRKFPTLRGKEKSLCAAIDRMLNSLVANSTANDSRYVYSEVHLAAAATVVDKWSGNGKWVAVNSLLRCWKLNRPEKRVGGTGTSGAVHRLVDDLKRAKKLKIGA